MQYTRITDFRKGLNTFYSPYDLPDGAFQKFENINNLKLGRIEKTKGLLNKSAQFTINLTSTPQGQGFFSYRTEYDGSSVQNSTLWWLIFANITTSDWRLKREDAADGTGGGF
ncbi:unnamed protein product, partial [marine sediment metagenome]